MFDALINALALDDAELSVVRSAASAGDMAGMQQAYLAYRRAKGLVQLQSGNISGEASDPEGDRICAHVIRNTGYDTLPNEAFMGTDFDWAFNPIPRNDPAYTEEWTWCVISRMGFWINLADAYARTQNERYAREWVAELRDFAAKNPLEQDGKNDRVRLWRTLDAAKRMAVSWPHAYRRFLLSPSFTPDANWLFLKLVYDHAKCLIAGLERDDRTGNWVTSFSRNYARRMHGESPPSRE